MSRRFVACAIVLAVLVAAFAVPVVGQGGRYTCDDVWDFFDQIYFLNISPAGEEICHMGGDYVTPNWNAEGSHHIGNICFRLGHVLNLANDLAQNMGCM